MGFTIISIWVIEREQEKVFPTRTKTKWHGLKENWRRREEKQAENQFRVLKLKNSTKGEEYQMRHSERGFHLFPFPIYFYNNSHIYNEMLPIPLNNIFTPLVTHVSFLSFKWYRHMIIVKCCVWLIFLLYSKRRRSLVTLIHIAIRVLGFWPLPVALPSLIENIFQLSNYVKLNSCLV